MASRHELRGFSLRRKANGDVYLRIDNAGIVYGQLVDRAFPRLNHNVWKAAEGSACYTYMARLTDAEFGELDSFLRMLRGVVLIGASSHLTPHFSGDLDQCIALAYTFVEGNNKQRTDVNELIYTAKHDRTASDSRVAEATADLTTRLANVIRAHPTYRTVDVLTCVPCYEPGRFHLSDSLAGMVCDALGRPHDQVVKKVSATRDSKDLALNEKRVELKSAFEVLADVRDRSILIVDDIYQSGTTLWTIARLLKSHGARSVFGLACVKTWSDKSNV